MRIVGMSFSNGLFHITAEHFKGSGVRTLIWPLWSAECLLFEAFCCWFIYSCVLDHHHVEWPNFFWVSDHKQTLWHSAPDISRNSLVPQWLQAVQTPRQQNSPISLHSPHNPSQPQLCFGNGMESFVVCSFFFFFFMNSLSLWRGSSSFLMIQNTSRLICLIIIFSIITIFLIRQVSF